MKRNNKKYSAILAAFVLFINGLFFVSCEKDQHVKPTPGPFEVSHAIPALVPATGGSYALTIDASTNGWWIEVSNNVSWVTVNRKYGSAKVVQNVVIQPNNSGQQRDASVTVRATNEDIVVIQIKQQ